MHRRFRLNRRRLKLKLCLIPASLRLDQRGSSYHHLIFVPKNCPRVSFTWDQKNSGLLLVNEWSGSGGRTGRGANWT